MLFIRYHYLGKVYRYFYFYFIVGLTANQSLNPNLGVIGRVSLARENEAGAVRGRKSIFSMLTYRTSFCFWL